MDDKSKKPESAYEHDKDVSKGAKPELNESYIPDFGWTPPAPPAGSVADAKPENDGAKTDDQ